MKLKIIEGGKALHDWWYQQQGRLRDSSSALEVEVDLGHELPYNVWECQ